MHLFSEVTYTEAGAAATERPDSRSTYIKGFLQGPTAATIAKGVLPLKQEIWQISICDLPGQLEDGYVLRVIEDVTKQPIAMVGQGPVRPLSISEAVLATMLSPVEGPAGGSGPCVCRRSSS